MFDESDNCPDHTNRAQKDTDLDAIGDVCDNCPYDFNPEQTNNDGDALGDKCDFDDDNDKIGKEKSKHRGFVVRCSICSTGFVLYVCIFLRYVNICVTGATVEPLYKDTPELRKYL